MTNETNETNELEKKMIDFRCISDSHLFMLLNDIFFLQNIINVLEAFGEHVTCNRVFERIFATIFDCLGNHKLFERYMFIE